MLRAVLAGLVLLALAPVRATAADPLVIDVILPLTGPAAYAGMAEQQTVRLYEALVNRSGGIHGRPLRFEIHDDGGNPVVDVQIVNALLPKKPVALIGPGDTATCSAVSPLLAGGAAPVEYCLSPVAVPPRDSYVFAILAPVQLTNVGLVRGLRAMGFRRLALLAATDASGQQAAKVLLDVLHLPENLSVALVEQQQFAPSDLSIAAQIAKIKAAGPDLVFVWAIGPAFLMAMREISLSGIDVPVMTNPFNGNRDLLAPNASILPKTLILAGLPYQAKDPPRALRDVAAEYLNAFREAGLKPPSVVQAYPWDPLRIIVSALRALPAGATPAQLHD